MPITRRTMLKSLGLAATLPLAGCFNSSVTRRIKVIAMAEVDGKQVEGSSVYELSWTDYGDRVKATEEGEAVVLELPGKGAVFVLSGDHEDDGLLGFHIWTWQVAHLVGSNGHINPELFSKVESLTGRYPYFRNPGMTMPVMVAFKDEKRFNSKYEVKAEDFPRLFGGAKFKGIDFEFTDEPMTKVLEQRLPSLKPPYENAPEGVFRDKNGRPRPAKDIPTEWQIGPDNFVSRG